MKLKYFRYSQNKGMSLIELLIAMTIGMLLMLGAITLFSNNKRIYREVNSMGRLQENARFAIELMIKDIRMAGYFGCAAQFSSTNSVINSTDFAYSLDAVDGYTGGAWGSGSNYTPDGIIANTDAIIIRSLSGDSTDVITTMTPDSTGNVQVTKDMTTDDKDEKLADPSLLFPGEIVVVSDCSNSDLFQISEVTNSGPQTDYLMHEASGTPGNSTTNLAVIYGPPAEVRRFEPVLYHIATGASGAPSLFRSTLELDLDNLKMDFQAVELIEGVERMEILYGVDNNSDTVADTYVKAADVGGTTATGGWDNVVSVQIALLFRTIRENFNSPLNVNTYTLLNSDAYDPVDDHHRRRIVTNTVQIRNRSN